MRKFSILFLVLFLSMNAMAQSWHWVYFTDKEGVSFNPLEYFHPKALERRAKEGLPLDHITDYPVSEVYIDAVSASVDSVSYSSRWFNALSVYAQPWQLEEVSKLPFVDRIEGMGGLKVSLSGMEVEPLVEDSDDILTHQTQTMGADRFWEPGIRGKGVRIAIFDAGFPDVDTHPAFEHLRENNQIKATYDFVQNGKKVYAHSAHGTMVLSCISGRYSTGKFMGLAQDAEFLLARTERGLLEPFSEEKNWLAALEWADKMGADIVNSSLGYTYHRYYPREMDGKTSLVSRAANMAFSKGILVINAAGNEGSDDWKVVGTPADAEKVISVGGIDPETHYHISFSSYGPTADGRMKPNLSAYGKTMVAKKKGEYGIANGTSFASPLVAGFAACAKQMAPNLTAEELKSELEASGSLFPFYDYAHGYGVPQSNYFFEGLVEGEPSFSWTLNDETITVSPKIITQREAQKEERYVYYHYENASGRLVSYGIYELDATGSFEVKIPPKGQVLRLHYLGYTEEISR